MDYKKKYNEALERARALWREAIEKEYVDDYLKDYETIFPELRESEDERIRKAIIELLKEVGRDDTGISENAKCMIAYLEKQEQKPELVQQPPITYTYNSNASRDERLKAALLALLNSDLLKVKEGGYFTKQDLIDWVDKQMPAEWKPSEEQMEALNKVRTLNPGLDALYQQLKNM